MVLYHDQDILPQSPVYVAKIMQTMASFAADLQGRTPLEALTGDTPDISQYLHFGFYDQVWFKEDAGLGETKLGKLIGVSHHIESLMSYYFFQQAESQCPEQPYNESQNWNHKHNNARNVLMCTTETFQTDSMRYTLKVTKFTPQTTKPT